jgi:hypothetical protein
MRFLLFLLLGSFACAASAPPDPRDTEAIKAAERVAKNFLASIDAGNAEGAEKFVYVRDARSPSSGRVTRNPVIKTHNEIEQRRRLGRLKNRTLTKTEILQEVSGFSTGLFVRFTYTVRYDKKETEQIETLTIKADNPQRWKVVGF